MRRLFVVNGLFSFLTCLSAESYRQADTIDVLVLFNSRSSKNAELEAQMRAHLDIESVTFLTDPDNYIDLFDDHRAMNRISRNPGEVRMFFTHNTWLHNRLFAAYPKANIVLYEEGMASYYPRLIDKYEHQDRIRSIRFHNALDAYLSPDALRDPRMGVIDRGAFTRHLQRVSESCPDDPAIGPDTVVVVEQYLFKKGRAQSIDSAADEYADAIRRIQDSGYRVAYRRHPRESTGLFDRITSRLGRARAAGVAATATEGILEASLLRNRAAAVAAISSTSLLTAPQYARVPAYRIPSLAPLDVAAAVGVERTGLVTNFIACAARVPALDELPGAGEGRNLMDQYTSRMHSAPTTAEDPAVALLGEADYGPEYVRIVKEIADPSVHAVSFDLFGTLVKRPTVDDADVFALLDKKVSHLMPPFIRFSEVRRTVWTRLNETFAARGGRPAEFALAQAYEYIGSVLGLDDEQVSELYRAELELEARLIRPRRSGVALTYVARAMGKTWGVTSDTYLTADELERVALRALPHAPAVVVSSLEHQKTKAAGTLFAVTAESFGEPAERIVHIGDRADHDVAHASEAGMRAQHLPAPARAALDHPGIKAVWEGVREEKASALLRGLVYSEVFDNPFRTFARESSVGADPALLGAMAVAPALIGWALWIVEEARSRGFDRLLFLARDGYLPLEIVRRIHDHPAAADPVDTRYAFCSRQAVFALFAQQPGHIAYTETVHGVNSRSNVKTLLTTRFGAEAARRFAPTLAAAGPRSADVALGRKANAVKTALAEVAQPIAELSAGADAGARAYFARQLDGAQRPAVVDVGYSGSGQRGIALATGQAVAGLYFTTMEHNTEHAYINDLEVAEFANDQEFFKAGGLLEYLITPPGLQTCVGFAVDGMPELRGADVPDPVRDAVHAGIRATLESFFSVFGADVDAFRMRPRLATTALSAFFHHPTRADAEMLAGGNHEDAISHSDTSVLKYWAAGRRALEEK